MVRERTVGSRSPHAASRRIILGIVHRCARRYSIWAREKACSNVGLTQGFPDFLACYF
jgi:hypothetical protein